MRFRKLKLNVETALGTQSATLEFSDGLTVVWADNSMGKSTCFRAMLVALGLEAMLTYSRSDLPLPPAIKSRIETPNGEVDVLQSEVLLEIENSAGNRIVTERTIKGTRNTDLISVHNGPILSDTSCVARAKDYFVNLPGSATRELGFHSFLADFLGWKLPTVSTFDGLDRLLYLQCIFPFLAVEQTRGWSSTQPPVPTQFRIRDVHKRTVEYLLDLDAHRVALRRQELARERSIIESNWTLLFNEAKKIADFAGGLVQSLPAKPVVTWPPQVAPVIVLSREDSWIALAKDIRDNEVLLSNLIENEIPRVEEIATTAEMELSKTERELRDKQAVLARLLDVLESEEDEVKRLNHRIQALDDDIQRHKDVKTIQRLGAMNSPYVQRGSCPVCHQPVQDSLIPIVAGQTVMSIEDNIKFLEEQKRTYELVLRNTSNAVAARRIQVNSLQLTNAELRSTIRSLKQTLISDARVPSIAAIRTQVSIESKIERNSKLLEEFDNTNSKFAELAEQWKRLQAELQKLPAGDTTSEDQTKILNWQSLVRNQLVQYGFKSFSPSKVSLSLDTYRPEHDGFELTTDYSSDEDKLKPNQNSTPLQNSISASDLIRTIWAYLLGLLELARTTQTNHPGCLIFDEPRQQSTRDVSFKELLTRASKAADANQQIIFFTSEESSRLKGHLDGLSHTLIEINGRVIK